MKKKSTKISENENIEKLSKVIEEKKKLPKEVKGKISSKIFENVLFVAIIIIYLGALNLGMTNIPTENYIFDLKVFSIMLLVGTIITFELAYKKDKSNLWVHGVEILVLAVFTTYLVNLYSMYYNTFGTLIFSTIGLYLIYYFVKILIERRKIIKQYKKSLVDIGEIVKKKS